MNKMLDKQKAMEFFENVKGKKIRLNVWLPDRYFVPNSFSWEDSVLDGAAGNITGKRFDPIDAKHETIKLPILNGFNEYDPFFNNMKIRWELFYPRNSVEKKENKCNCPINILMSKGCQCGGI